MTGLFEGNVSTLSVKNQVLSLVSFYQKIKQNQKNQDKNQKMKKIRILFEWKIPSPKAFIDRIQKNTKGIIAEAVSIDKVVQNKDGEYAVNDRISQDVPFIVPTLKCCFNGN
jgi:hypothetical protein